MLLTNTFLRKPRFLEPENQEQTWLPDFVKTLTRKTPVEVSGGALGDMLTSPNGDSLRSGTG